MSARAEPSPGLPPLDERIAALPTYISGMSLSEMQRLSGRSDLARMASNENPDGCAPGVLAALSGAVLEPWRYADPACAALRGALGKLTGIAPGRIVMGNGSEEMILAAARVILGPGKALLTVLPSFGLHGICARSVGAEVRHVTMTPGGSFDIAGLERELSRRPAMLAFSSPWNPVGTALDTADLARLLAAAEPGHTAILFDEVYFEYADPATRPDVLSMLVSWGGRWAVLRSFSKAYGLAGLRVGYALCSDAELAATMTNARTPFNVNAAAQAGAMAALADQEWMRGSVARCTAERERVAEALGALGFPMTPSQTNFLFIDCGADAEEAATGLLRSGIVVKPWREAGYERFLRVTIGTPSENDRLIAAMAGLPRASQPEEHPE
ncbi:MAG: aminotransferase class I/II-fold pyridoxal phosphate-dependent enzyme [Rhodobacteraceae bacterium]|nr:aminotransferase class I/II-fold pyridoxal phosphate-dependent enzyme [Paracoccaceae bacterium]